MNDDDPLNRYDGPERGHQNGASVNTRFGSLHLWGRWGAVLALLAIGVALTSLSLAYGLWTFSKSLDRFVIQMHDEHVQVLAAVKDMVRAQENATWTQSQQTCLLLLPSDGLERLNAKRYGDACAYAMHVYAPKPGTPKIVVVPSRPDRADRPSMPASGFPSTGVQP